MNTLFYPLYLDILNEFIHFISIFKESKKYYKRKRERERERERISTIYVLQERHYDITRVSSEYTKESLSFFFAKLWLIIVHTYVEMQVNCIRKGIIEVCDLYSIVTTNMKY